MSTPDGTLTVALRNLPQYISKSGLIGPDKHSAMLCFEELRAALASAQAREEELRAEVDKWRSTAVFGACGLSDHLTAMEERATAAEASAERWRSRYIAEVVCYRVDQNGDSESKALAAAHAAAENLDHLDKARAALSTNAATQTGETNEAAE